MRHVILNVPHWDNLLQIKIYYNSFVGIEGLTEGEAGINIFAGAFSSSDKYQVVVFPKKEMPKI